MATTIRKQKQLGELLQEKQEPFMLDMYLLEKGCLKNRFTLDNSVCCYSVNSRGILNRSLKFGACKRSRNFPSCSKVVKAMFGKIVLVSKRQKGKKDYRSNEQEVSGSFSDIDIENIPNSVQKKEIQTKSNLRLSFIEDTSKELKLSPDSVLDKAPLCDVLLAHGNRKQIFKSRDSFLEVPDCKFTIQLPLNEPLTTDFSSRYSSTKMVLQQSKQLLFDCVRELLESNKWKLRKENNLLRCLGADDINKLLCDDIRVWSKLSGKESNIKQLLNVDFGLSIGEWRDFEQQTREISKEIGDAIFEQISKEIVDDMVSFR